METEPRHDEWVEAFDAHVAPVFSKQSVGLFAQLDMAAAALQLDDERAAASDGREHLGEERNGILRAAEPQLRKLGICFFVNAAVHAADALEVIVMEHHDLAVL